MTALVRPTPVAGLRARVHVRDRHVRLALGLALPAWVVPLVATDSAASLGVGVVYVLAQVGLGLPPARRVLGRQHQLVRLALAVMFVVTLTGLAQDGVERPVTVLYLPIVALAASVGLREAVIIGGLVVVALLAPLVASLDFATRSSERALMFVSASVLLTIGTRGTIDALERQGRRLRDVVRRDRRRARQLAGIEAVGDILAANGPTDESLDAVVSLLASTFGYRYVSIYLEEAGGLRLGASRGYAETVDRFEHGRGVVGRVATTGTLAFLPDVSTDPDYVAVDAAVASKIAAPLLVDDRVFGVLNVESDVTYRLDGTDVATVRLVADRLAAAVALGARRAAIQARADALGALVTFSRGLAETLDAQTLYDRVASSVPSVVAADIVSVAIRRSGRFILTAQSGAENAPWLGIEIAPGEGMAGRAITARTIVATDRYEPGDHLRRGESAAPTVPPVAAAVPLIHDEDVVGAISLFRTDAAGVFTDLELDTLRALGAQVAVAVVNAQLHAEVAESAVRDPLTGLYNRRHFDAEVTRLFAGRERRKATEPVAIVLFDLDLFGEVNKKHGHSVGDDVLRAFGALLSSRFRRSDLVARYGGEEFVAVLEGSTGEVAETVANEIRTRFQRLPLTGVTGKPLRHSVSAGVVADENPDADPLALFATADVALAVAKRGGRNQVVRF